MIRILDIGNTHTRIADWDGEKFCQWRVIDTDSVAEEYQEPDFPAAAACVCPEVQMALEGRGIRFISALSQESEVDFHLIDRKTIGADRVANAIALAEFFPLPGAVIDCGTAITLELVDEQKRFVGGAIAPGRSLMRRSLALGTAQLPETALLNEVPELPGCNTQDAIGFGVGRGAIGVVRELADAAKKMFDLKTLILTGGDAAFFHQALPEAKVCTEEFTLHGVRIAAGFR